VLLWVGLGGVAVTQLVARARDYVPNDLAMYLRAGEWWGEGRNPYTEAFRQAGGDTLPYVYPPGTLAVFEPLAGLAPEVASVLWFVAGVVLSVWSLLYFRRRYAPGTPQVLAVGLVAAYFPAYFALTHGNVAVLLLPAAVVVHRILQGDGAWRDVVAGTMVGAICGFKPYWLLAFAPLLLAARAWRGLAGLVAGLAGVGVATLTQRGLVGDWLAATGGVDRLAASALPANWWLVITGVLIVGWLAVGGWWVRRRRPRADQLFVFATTSVVVWPRVGAYSYLILVPALLHLAERRGWRVAGPLLAVASSPALWVVERSVGGGGGRLVLYGWAVVCAGLVWWELRGLRNAPQFP
jgi:hypothetical protein